MKKILSILISTALVFSLFTTTAIKSKGSAIHPSITFSSLDDFLNAYLATKEGSETFNYIKKVGELDLTEFETFYLPTGIFEGFIIREITIVSENLISFHYLPKNIENKNNININFFIFLSNSENRMHEALRVRNQTVDDLIDGKYSFYYIPNSYILFNWLSDEMFWGLRIDLSQQDTEEFKTLFGDGEILELVRFAETAVVDLTDEEDIKILLSGSGARYRKGDVNGDGKTDTADALEILKHEAGLPNVISGNDRAFAAADVNGDGRIDTEDALEILKYEAGLPSAIN